MSLLIAQGLLIPFFGTALGSACVLFMKNYKCNSLQGALSGFSAGVMTAASIWSLLIPSAELSQNLGKASFIPAAVGFCAGMIFLMLTEKFEKEKKDMMAFAVILHNIPEGMAVGAACAGLLEGKVSNISSLLILSIGIAVQNIPEGAIISMPAKITGNSKGKAFLKGVLSGAVEPIAGAVTVLLSSLIIPILPYTLSFAAGAMIYVVICELIPEINNCRGQNGVLMFMFGFSVMMILDIALG